jgi:hypothetical protein
MEFSFRKSKIVFRAKQAFVSFQPTTATSLVTFGWVYIYVMREVTDWDAIIPAFVSSESALVND